MDEDYSTVYVVDWDEEIIDSYDSQEEYAEYVKKNATVRKAATALCEYFEYHNKNLTKKQESLIDDLNAALERGIYGTVKTA